MIEKLRAGAEQATSRARESVREADLRHDLGMAYRELGRTAFALVEQGVLTDVRLGSGADRIRMLEGQLSAVATQGFSAPPVS